MGKPQEPDQPKVSVMVDGSVTERAVMAGEKLAEEMAHSNTSRTSSEYSTSP